MKRARARNAETKAYKISIHTAVSRPSAIVLFVSRGKLPKVVSADCHFGGNFRFESRLLKSDRSACLHHSSSGSGAQSREVEA